MPRNNRSRLFVAGLVFLFLGKVILLSGCGSSTASSTPAVSSAKEYAQGARSIEENNRKHVKEGLAARKAARAR